MTGSDRITYSAVGDGESWDTDDNDASTGQWIDIGYGDSGDIIAVVPLATDLMIIKNNGMIYQLTGDADPASWAVYRVATETDPTGRQAAVPIGNDAVFMSRVGLRTLSTTMDYGNIATGDIGQKFSQLVVQSQFDPQLFNLRRHNLPHSNYFHHGDAGQGGYCIGERAVQAGRYPVRRQRDGD